MDREAFLKQIDEVIAKGPYKAEWSDLTQVTVPRWFTKEKFGIFIHWGVFSVPAFGNEWYSRCMYEDTDKCYKHHLETYGPHKDFGYKDFIPMFKAEKFDADEWMRIIKSSGARYVVPVAEHHDGFAMYDSDMTDWCAAKMGPCRDTLGELKTAAEKAGITFAASSHRAEHYWFQGVGRHFESDIKGEYPIGHIYWPSVSEQPDMGNVHDPVASSKEFLDDWLMRCCEIVDKYQPLLMYFDWWIMHESYKDHLKKFLAYYNNRAAEWGKEVCVIYKHDPMPFGAGIPDVERGKFATSQPYTWQTDTAIAYNSWCYIDGLEYKKADEILAYLVDVVSKNGNLLLNIGPKSDGTIPEKDKEILAEIGKWLDRYGEAIYEAKPWKKAAEGPTEEREGKFSDVKDKEYTNEDFRFTVGHGAIYAISLNYPKDGKLFIKSLGVSEFNSLDFQGIIVKASIPGYGEVKFTQKQEGLYIEGPAMDTKLPVVIKVETN